MKLFTTISALASVAHAHYVFPSLIANGAATGEWTNVRQWTGYYSNGPVTDVNSLSIRCNVDASTKSAKTLTIAAGSTLGFSAKASISHPGLMQFYMAKVPAGNTADAWDGSGSVWFKVFNDMPGLGASMTWPTQGQRLSRMSTSKRGPEADAREQEKLLPRSLFQSLCQMANTWSGPSTSLCIPLEVPEVLNSISLVRR